MLSQIEYEIKSTSRTWFSMQITASIVSNSSWPPGVMFLFCKPCSDLLHSKPLASLQFQRIPKTRQTIYSRKHHWNIWIKTSSSWCEFTNLSRPIIDRWIQNAMRCLYIYKGIVFHSTHKRHSKNIMYNEILCVFCKLKMKCSVLNV